MKGRAEGAGFLAHGRIDGDSTLRHLHQLNPDVLRDFHPQRFS